MGVLGIAAWVLAVQAAASPEYPDEPRYPYPSGPDEKLVGVSLVNNRWPDSSTLESAVADIFRLEGVSDRARTPDPDRALALWKWFRILVSATGGGYAYEGPAGSQEIVRDPHKILTVYGHHQCDGQSWTLVALWRAAGYMALDECHLGHTTAALRYRDADGVMRYHSFDPQKRYYYWNSAAGRGGTWTLPVMTGTVFRHVIAPRELHSLRTGLRPGETIRRLWSNSGCVVPGGGVRGPDTNDPYYAPREGRDDGVYNVAGEQVQTLVASPDPAVLEQQLAEGSQGWAVGPEGDGGARFRPARPGEPGILVFRLPPPFPVVDLSLSARLRKSRSSDVCRLQVRRDGGPWVTVFEKTEVGEEEVRLELGREARRAGRPDVYTAYEVQVRAEFRTSEDPRGVGMSSFRMTARRPFNRRTQPNLMPGTNLFRVSADRLAEGWALRLKVDVGVNGREVSTEHRIREFPYYFRIEAPMTLRHLTNYDQEFGREAVMMRGYTLELVPAGREDCSRSFPRGSAEVEFARSFPHPADLNARQEAAPETDPRQTSGFLPQGEPRRLRDPARVEELLRKADGKPPDSWLAVQELGAYPEAAAALIARLEKADGDLTLFLCKALAEIGDRRALEPLRRKWEKAPSWGPGTRYIPDVLAALGDVSAVPALAAKLPRVRFDYRLHIARALGILGGPEAREALERLAERDPFPPVREEAREALRRLR